MTCKNYAPAAGRCPDKPKEMAAAHDLARALGLTIAPADIEER